MSEGKYKTSAALRIALEERLSRFAKESGQDIMRLRRQVAFDRLLARMFMGNSVPLILKGGYALELRLKYARTTKDIDFSLRNKPANPDEFREMLQEHASVNLDDGFEFIMGNGVLDLENAPYGGFRFPIEAWMAGRLFIRFEMDIGAGDAWMDPHDRIQLHDWLDFAGIPTAEVPVISIEQQFAEKLHAYTLPRKPPNSRVKDLVDIVLLIEKTDMNIASLCLAVATTFKKRKNPSVPKNIEDPPESWKVPFNKMAAECGLSMEIGAAISIVRKFCRTHKLTGG